MDGRRTWTPEPTFGTPPGYEPLGSTVKADHNAHFRPPIGGVIVKGVPKESAGSLVLNPSVLTPSVRFGPVLLPTRNLSSVV